MTSKLLGTAPLDLAALEPDLAFLRGIPRLAEVYDEFSSGGYRNHSLWNATGDSSDSRYRANCGQAQQTEFGAAVTLLEEAMHSIFVWENVRMVRARNLQDGVIFPHRDFVEFDRPHDYFYRAFLALEAAPLSFHSDDSGVFQMQPGEVWFLDAASVHAAANLTSSSRLHICVDLVFDHVPSEEELFCRGALQPGPPPTYLHRLPLPDCFGAELASMASLINLATLKDSLTLLTRCHFLYDSEPSDVWQWLRWGVATSPNNALRDKVDTMEQHMVHARCFGRGLGWDDWPSVRHDPATSGALTMAIIDLRSDTVTIPDAAMRSRLAEADVGDDAYGDDTTVIALEQRCARLLGKAAAVFTCSGTMSNQLAIGAQTTPGGEVITEGRYHVNYYESAQVAAYSHVSINAVRAPAAVLDGDLVRQAICAKARGTLYATPQLLCLENTIGTTGGTVADWSSSISAVDVARAHDMSVHLDGARLAHAAVATGRSMQSWASIADTVSTCFSKGLGAPFGSVLAGEPALIERARQLRKWHGGGLHQAGLMAAASLHALGNLDRLDIDHANARRLAAALSGHEALRIDPSQVQTNMVLVDVSTYSDAQTFADRLAAAGVLMSVWGPTTLRAVCHLGVSVEEVDEAAAIVADVASHANLLRTKGGVL